MKPPATSAPRLLLWALALVVAAASLLGWLAPREWRRLELVMPAYEGKVNAPEFPEGLEWLNTERPLRMSELRGKVVLLDFWTYCCINCLHVIPELKRLEARYPNELVVIGVHSAKFVNEREAANIRQAVLRYGIEHPVLNDAGLRLWGEYGVRAWPTLVLIDPAGKVAGYVSGEGHFDTLDRAIAGLVAAFEAKGQLDRRPLELRPEREGEAGGLLSFPGKVLADEASGRLFIADTAHHRLLAVRLEDGALLETIGSGEPGLRDGGFEEARFNQPRGMALAGERLYVADTENHAIRAVELAARRVETLAGTGEQARGRGGAGRGREAALNSPWDVTLHGGWLYIAMAGPHQLWRLEPASGRVEPHAGSGREARVDGPLMEAALAQPSGITTDGRRLYFADSEVSSIRAADLDPAGRVETIVGGDLFEFGDRDGQGLKVRLQHPIGLTHHAGLLYVADTYNHKIKVVDPARRTAATLLGTGRAGLADGESPLFYEPEGVSVAAGRLYIADTNNHAVRVADLESGRVSTLAIKTKAQPVRKAAPARKLPPQVVAPGGVVLRVALDFAPGHKLNSLAESSVAVSSSEEAVVSAPEQVSTREFPIALSLEAREGEAVLMIELAVNYCRAKGGLCLYQEAALRLPVRVVAGADSRALTVSLPLGF